MSASPAKFMFETEFGSGEPRRPKQTAAQEAAERAAEQAALDIAAAEARGHAAGVIVGEGNANARELARIANALQQCAANAQRLVQTLDQTNLALEQEAVGLAVQTAHTLCKSLIEAEPLAEIERVAREALTHVRRAPHIVLRVAPDLVERVEERMKTIAWEAGYEGRVVIMGDPDAATGDCRLEWADGGLKRDSAVLAAAVDDAIARYIAARAGGNKE